MIIEIQDWVRSRLVISLKVDAYLAVTSKNFRSRGQEWGNAEEGMERTEMGIVKLVRDYKVSVTISNVG